MHPNKITERPKKKTLGTRECHEGHVCCPEGVLSWRPQEKGGDWQDEGGGEEVARMVAM